MKHTLTLHEAQKILKKNNVNSNIVGNSGTVFQGIASIDAAKPNEVVMLRAKAKSNKTVKLINLLNSKKVAAVITTEELSKEVKNAPMLITENPRLAFSYIMGLNEEATIHKSATIFECVTLGKNVSVGANTIIGSSGLSINRHDEKLINTTHVGGVVIMDNVTIGGNSVIVRAVMGNTIIGEYSLLAHGISIGHGCILGKRVKIAPGVVVSGSCKIADDVWIGPNASLRENISIGEGAFIGIGSVVLEDVSENTIVGGNPAKIIKGSKKPW